MTRAAALGAPLDEAAVAPRRRESVAAEEELVTLERRGWEALSAGGGAAAAFYEGVLASEVLMLLPGGLRLEDRGTVIDSMRGAPWEAFELHDLQVLPLGRDGAVVAYRAAATRDGQRYEALVSSTYVVEDGRWRLAAHQQTPL
jgi:hypothetical protein